jgi:acetylornithine deacetylase
MGETKSDPLFPPGHFAISPAVFSGGKRHVPSPAYIPDQASLVYAVFYPPAETADTVRAEIESCIAAVAASDPWLADTRRSSCGRSLSRPPPSPASTR